MITLVGVGTTVFGGACSLQFTKIAASGVSHHSRRLAAACCGPAVPAGVA